MKRYKVRVQVEAVLEITRFAENEEDAQDKAEDTAHILLTDWDNDCDLFGNVEMKSSGQRTIEVEEEAENP